MIAKAPVILSKQSGSKDFGINLTANVNEMRRILDSAYASLGMTFLYFVPIVALFDENR